MFRNYAVHVLTLPIGETNRRDFYAPLRQSRLPPVLPYSMPVRDTLGKGVLLVP